MTITLDMRNVVSCDVKTVMLRKFFQMVFVGNDRKSLHIYTATIIGASDTMYSSTDMNSKTKFISKFQKVPHFRMLFDYTVSGNDTNLVKSISHKDITEDDERSLFFQIDHLKKVWGVNAEKIYNDQPALMERFVSVTNGGHCDTAELSKHNVLYINEKKPFCRHFLQTIAVKGIMIDNLQMKDCPPKKEDYTARNTYAIECPVFNMPDGLELVNWVRTTIEFQSVIDDKDFNFCIQRSPVPTNQAEAVEKSKAAQNPSGTAGYIGLENPAPIVAGMGENIQPVAPNLTATYDFLCPDFTWYFSPPVKSFIDHRNASVEIKRTHASNPCSNCPCPQRATNPVSFNSNTKLHDGINPVPNKLTVEFDYWVKEEKIKSRQKYRFAAKDISLSAEEFSSISEIMMCLDMTDDHNRGNRQYILGLFISFALSFGIDSTRISAVKQYFPSFLGFAADTFWLIFLVMFSLTMLFQPPKISDKWDQRASIIRKACLWASLFWFMFVFSFSNNSLILTALVTNQTMITSITRGCYAGIFLVEFIYILYLNVRHKDRILSGLFGETIL